MNLHRALRIRHARLCALLPLLQAGCGGREAAGETSAPVLVCDAEAPPAGAPCGRNGRGQVVVECASTGALAECRDPDECTDGALRNSGRTCPGGGWLEETCEQGRWSTGECRRPLECQPGTERVLGPCPGGVLVRACGPDGAEQEPERCVAAPEGGAAECVAGAARELDQPCGKNGRGRLSQGCLDGRWTEPTCEDPDVCLDGLAETWEGCSRTCVHGVWTEPGCGFCGSRVIRGDVEVATDEELARLAGVEEVRGWLVVGQDVTSLAPLAALQCVGVFQIEQTRIRDLAGLGSLHSGNLSLWKNLELGSLEGLGPVAASFELAIRQSPELTSLAGLAHVTELGSLALQDLEQLPSLEGLEQLRALGSLSISGNTKLSSLEGMPLLEEVGELSVQANPLLQFRGSNPETRSQTVRISESHLTRLDWSPFAPSMTELAINAPLTELTGLAEIEEVDSLSLDGVAVPHLHGLSGLRKAGTVSLDGRVDSLEGLGPVELGELFLSTEGDAAMSLAPGSTVDRLKVFGPVTSLAGLSASTVRALSLYRTRISTLSDLGPQPLTLLVLEGNQELTSLEGIDAARLVHVVLDGSPVATLEPLRGVSGLATLTLRHLPAGTDFGFLETAEWVDSLELSSLAFPDFLTLPPGLPVRWLELRQNTISSLAGLSRLEPQSVDILDNQLSECLVEEYRAELAARGFEGQVRSQGNLPCVP